VKKKSAGRAPIVERKGGRGGGDAKSIQIKPPLMPATNLLFLKNTRLPQNNKMDFATAGNGGTLAATTPGPSGGGEPKKLSQKGGGMTSVLQRILRG